MRVGMIGLGRMGEGMSRRLIAAGHEVHGYRNNYAKSQEQFEKRLYQWMYHFFGKPLFK